MSPLNFPNDPSAQVPINTFSPTSTPKATTNGVTYTYQGGKWASFSESGEPSLPLTGGNLTGDLTIGTTKIALGVNGNAAFEGKIISASTTSGDAAETLATKDYVDSTSGSAGVTSVNGDTGEVVVTPDSIDALALAGGTMTGDIVFNAGQSFPGVLSLTGGAITGDVTYSSTTQNANNIQTKASVEALISNLSGGFTFKGDVDITSTAPASPEGGDFYLSLAAGTVNASWTGIAGQSVLANQVVVYSESASRWFTGAVQDVTAYLLKSGGNMTGDLTLGTDKAVLSATTGNISLGPSKVTFDATAGTGVFDGSVITGGSLYVDSDSNFGLFKDGLSLKLKVSSTTFDFVNDGRFLVPNKIRPKTDGDVDLGGSSYRWNNVYSEAGNFSGTVTVGGISSDGNLVTTGTVTGGEVSSTNNIFATNNITANGSGSFVGKVSSAATLASDPGTTLTTKSYVDSVGAGAIISGVAPATRVNGDPLESGDLWWNSSTSEGSGDLFVYYVDADSSQWVMASPPPPPNPTDQFLSRVDDDTAAGRITFEKQITLPGGGSGAEALQADEISALIAAGGNRTLQQVTDAGNTTTKGATFGDKVGINTGSPRELLDVSANSGARISVGTSDTSMSGGGDYGGFCFYTNDSSNPNRKNWDIRQIAIGSIGNTNLAIDSWSTSNLVYLEANGNVGIGTDDPQQKLEISADGISSDPVMRISRGSSYYWEIGHINSDFQFNSQSGGTIMQLNFDGNVGIGTTSPSDKLQVNGSASATSVKAGNITTSSNTISGTGSLTLLCAGSGLIYFKSKSSNSEYRFYKKDGTLYAALRSNLLTASRNISLPNASGTLALTSNLSAYLPLAGGTLSGILSTNSRCNLGASIGVGTDADLDAARLLVSGSPSSGSEVGVVARFNRSPTTSTQNFKFKLDNTGNFITGSTNNTNTKSLILRNESPAQTIQLQTRYSTSQDSITRLTVQSNGTITVAGLSGSGTRALYVSSAGTLTTTASDASLKTNVADIVTQTDVVKALRPVSYNWIDTEERGEQKEIGFIAQEVKELVPEIIGANNDGTLTLDYARMVPVLTKALQEALARIEALENA